LRSRPPKRSSTNSKSRSLAKPSFSMATPIPRSSKR
jgi:hypothetical protein